MQEPFFNTEKLLGKEFDDAPRQLKAIIQQILSALEKKNAGQNNCGETFNYLRQADKLVQNNQLKEWQAELHAVWALYYRHGCPNLEDKGKTEDSLMWHHIAYAQRLEPDNQTLNRILDEIKRT